MKLNKTILILTTLSGLTLLIEFNQFYRMGVYVDEYGTSPNIVFGGNFWLYVAWIKLFLLLVIFIFLWIKLFSKK